MEYDPLRSGVWSWEFSNHAPISSVAISAQLRESIGSDFWKVCMPSFFLKGVEAKDGVSVYQEDSI